MWGTTGIYRAESTKSTTACGVNISEVVQLGEPLREDIGMVNDLVYAVTALAIGDQQILETKTVVRRLVLTA